MDVKTLAHLVLRVLEQQQLYFETRDRFHLIESKKLEAQLRKECREILSSQENLF